MQLRLFLHEEKKRKTERKGAADTHTPFTHAVKNQRYKLEWHQKVFHIRRKKKTFHTEIFTAGWTNIKTVEENVCVCVCHLQHVCRFGRTCVYGSVKNSSKVIKMKQWTKTGNTENDTNLAANRRRSRHENGCTLYKTIASSHPDRWEHREENCYNRRGEILTESYLHVVQWWRKQEVWPEACRGENKELRSDQTLNASCSCTLGEDRRAKQLNRTTCYILKWCT